MEIMHIRIIDMVGCGRIDVHKLSIICNHTNQIVGCKHIGLWPLCELGYDLVAVHMKEEIKNCCQL